MFFLANLGTGPKIVIQNDQKDAFSTAWFLMIWFINLFDTFVRLCCILTIQNDFLPNEQNTAMCQIYASRRGSCGKKSSNDSNGL